MPGVIPTPTGSRQPQSTAERAFASAKQHATKARKAVAEAARALKDARNALDSAIAQHGPAAPLTDIARTRWRQARARMKDASERCEAAETGLERTLQQWAQDAAPQHQPSHVARRFPSEAEPPPGEARAPCSPTK